MPFDYVKFGLVDWEEYIQQQTLVISDLMRKILDFRFQAVTQHDEKQRIPMYAKDGRVHGTIWVGPWTTETGTWWDRKYRKLQTRTKWKNRRKHGVEELWNFDGSLRSHTLWVDGVKASRQGSDIVSGSQSSTSIMSAQH